MGFTAPGVPVCCIIASLVKSSGCRRWRSELVGIGGGNRHLFRGLALRFSIGQIQDVGLIFLAGMATFHGAEGYRWRGSGLAPASFRLEVRNIVHWGRLSSLSPAVLVTTGLWQCLSSSQAGNGSIGTLPKSRKIATSRRSPSQECGRDESRSNLGHWPRVDKK